MYRTNSVWNVISFCWRVVLLLAFYFCWRGIVFFLLMWQHNPFICHWIELYKYTEMMNRPSENQSVQDGPQHQDGSLHLYELLQQISSRVDALYDYFGLGNDNPVVPRTVVSKAVIAIASILFFHSFHGAQLQAAD